MIIEKFFPTIVYGKDVQLDNNKLAQDIGSIVIVPKISSQNFGDLFQITSEPNEIFVSSATVDDVEIVDSVTSTELRNNSTVNIFGGYTPTTLRT